MNITNFYNFNNDKIEDPNSNFTLYSEPKQITFSENNRAFQFSGVTESTSPIISQNYILIPTTATISVGDTITISNDLIDITLVGSLTLKYFTDFYVGGTHEDTLDSLYYTLSNNIAVTNYYEIFRDNSLIILRGKDYGPKYDLSISSSNASISFSQCATFGCGTNKFKYDSLIDYKGFVEVYIPREDAVDIFFGNNHDKLNYIKIDEYLLPFVEGDSKIKIEIPKNYLEAELPDYGLDFNQLNGHLKPYFISYGDSQRFTKNFRRNKNLKGVSSVRWTQIGAVDTLLDYSTTQYVVNATTLQLVQPLTGQMEKTVTLTSHEYQQFIFQKYDLNDLNVTKKVRYTFIDGTTQEIDYSQGNFKGLDNNYSFNCSPQWLDIPNIESTFNNNVLFYEVWFEFDVDTINQFYSDPKKYNYNVECKENQKQIIFLNSYGAYDSLSFAGQKVDNFEVNRQTIETALPFNANTPDGYKEKTHLDYNIDVNDTHTIYTELLNDDEYLYTKELLKSQNILEWDADLLIGVNELGTELFGGYRFIQLDSYEFGFNTKTNNHTLIINYKKTNKEKSVIL